MNSNPSIRELANIIKASRSGSAKSMAATRALVQKSRGIRETAFDVLPRKMTHKWKVQSVSSRHLEHESIISVDENGIILVPIGVDMVGDSKVKLANIGDEVIFEVELKSTTKGEPE